MNILVRLLVTALFLFGEVPLSYANVNMEDNSHSKTKTLATLGSINVADETHSDTAMLNRDINDNEVDIYDIESHKGIKGSLDTRLLTDTGRAQIAEEVKKSKVGFYDVAKDIITKDSLTILDAFSHQGNKVDFFDGMQDAIRSDKALQKQLADPNLTVEQKNELMTTLASSVAAKLDIKLGDVSTIATDATTNKGEQIKGAYHEGSNDIVINDVNTDGTGDAVNTLGHELGHAVGYGEEASKVMGESLQDYADFAMWNNTDGQTVADTNNHNGTKDNQGNTIATTDKASQNFVQRHIKGELDYRQLSKAEAKSLDKTKEAISTRTDLTSQQKVVMKVQLDAAACAAVRCAEGVPESDKNYQQLVQLQSIGDKLKEQGLTVDKMLATPANDGDFEYGFMDKGQDFVTRHDEAVQRAKGVVNAGLGAAGVAVGTAATVTTAPLLTTGIGAVVPVGTAILTGAAATQFNGGVESVLADYNSVEGQRVLDSFTEETHQGDRYLAKDAAINIALWVGETVVINKVAKLIPDGVKDLITSKKAGTPSGQVPISNQEAFDISYYKHLGSGKPPRLAKKDAQVEIDSFQGQIYKQDVKKGDVLVVNHTGGETASGHYAIDIKQADKTPEQLQTELALPRDNSANAQTKITIEEPHTILSGAAADKSGEPWAHNHATGGGEQKVIDPTKTNAKEMLQ